MKAPIVSTNDTVTKIDSTMQDGRIIRFIIAADVNGNPIVDIQVDAPTIHCPEFLGTIYCPTSRKFQPGDEEVPTGAVVTDVKVKLNRKFIGQVEEY